MFSLIRLRYYYRRYNPVYIVRDYFRRVRMRRINYPLYIHNQYCINTCIEYTPTWVETLENQRKVPPPPQDLVSQCFWFHNKAHIFCILTHTLENKRNLWVIRDMFVYRTLYPIIGHMENVRIAHTFVRIPNTFQWFFSEGS